MTLVSQTNRFRQNKCVLSVPCYLSHFSPVRWNQPPSPPSSKGPTQAPAPFALPLVLQRAPHLVTRLKVRLHHIFCDKMQFRQLHVGENQVTRLLQGTENHTMNSKAPCQLQHVSSSEHSPFSVLAPGVQVNCPVCEAAYLPSPPHPSKPLIEEPQASLNGGS